MARKEIDPVALLKDDHEKVKGLFDKFENAKSDSAKKNAARKAIMELKVHAAIEEEIFYPACDTALDSEEGHDILLEAEEEHHVVHLLIAELDAMADDDEHFDAKFTVLAENVRHHIEEEEKEMLPKAEKAVDSDMMSELGQKMAERKKTYEEELKTESRDMARAS
jgi:hemerythrin superfamily protein